MSNARVWASNLPGHLRHAPVQELVRELERYPTPLGFGRPEVLNDGRTPLWNLDNALAVNWPAEQTPERGPGYVDIYQTFDKIAVRHPDGSNWLIPPIDNNDRVPYFLQAWWLVLFSLSIFTRYHPAQWRIALDVDQSHIAVALEHALDVALKTLPELIFWALRELSATAINNDQKPRL
jgi:hypothetical protein